MYYIFILLFISKVIILVNFLQLQEQAQLQLARAIYASGTPLNIVENKLWLKFFHTLRPSFKVPK